MLDTGIRHVDTAARAVGRRVRRYAYRYSEGRAAHWLLLLGADRVDAIQSHLRSFATMRPDNPLTQTGIRSEFTHNGMKARTGTTRVDNAHTWMAPFIVTGPWVVVAAVLIRLGWALAKRRRPNDRS